MTMISFAEYRGGDRVNVRFRKGILDSSKDDFEDGDEVYEAIGEVLHEVAEKPENEVRSVNVFAHWHFLPPLPLPCPPVLIDRVVIDARRIHRYRSSIDEPVFAPRLFPSPDVSNPETFCAQANMHEAAGDAEGRRRRQRREHSEEEERGE